MELKEQNFDFTKETLTENLVNWIIGFARIPLQNCVGTACIATIEALAATPGFEKKLYKNGNYTYSTITFTETGFYIQEEDPDCIDQYSLDNLFELDVTPYELENTEVDAEIHFIFSKNNKACFFYQGEIAPPYQERYDEYEKRMEMPNDMNLTWQEAYDLICKISKDEQNSVPNCSV